MGLYFLENFFRADGKEQGYYACKENHYIFQALTEPKEDPIQRIAQGLRAHGNSENDRDYLSK